MLAGMSIDDYIRLERSLVGVRHVRVLPVAALIGACTVVLADVIGRTLIAPAQIPAGIMTVLVGTPLVTALFSLPLPGHRDRLTEAVARGLCP